MNRTKSRNRHYPLTKYVIGKTKDLAIIEFATALRRSIACRINNSFIYTYKPVMDDMPYRVFNSTSSYRSWCRKRLPRWLGYAR